MNNTPIYWEKEKREKALKLTPIGEEIMLNSKQVRRDSKTIVLIRKKEKK